MRIIECINTFRYMYTLCLEFNLNYFNTIAKLLGFLHINNNLLLTKLTTITLVVIILFQ